MAQANNKNFTNFLVRQLPHKVAMAAAPKSQQYSQQRARAALRVAQKRRLPLTQQKFDQQRLSQR